MNEVAILIIWLVLAFLIGFFLGRVIPKIKTSGTLKIDTTDPFSDKWSFEIDDDLCTIPKRRQIALKIKIVNNGVPENAAPIMNVLTLQNEKGEI